MLKRFAKLPGVRHKKKKHTREVTLCSSDIRFHLFTCLKLTYSPLFKNVFLSEDRVKIFSINLHGRIDS